MYHVRACSLAAGHRGLFIFSFTLEKGRSAVAISYGVGAEVCAARGNVLGVPVRAPGDLAARAGARAPAGFQTRLKGECSHRRNGILKMRVSLPSHSACTAPRTVDHSKKNPKQIRTASELGGGSRTGVPFLSCLPSFLSIQPVASSHGRARTHAG